MTPEVRLAALAAHLAARKLDVELGSKGLRVANPQVKGCCSPHATDTIACRTRDEDAGRLWYFTSWGEPIAPADRVTDAAVFVLGYLSGEER
ncbi:hypothetical protein E1293_24005 [Actinomadura darangshiensis]|uniref:Uncharacterized protein n=1 Tax=Actinomadura darangshiensis TaxID=705336 RepID=A0A4R5AZZ6_9ACTN|nr:hypothetical protein [Actinomadura darangshiensis]TDD79218.1 hypothetical protein E1293_24005 [Actinomadura darangshiensis]